MRGIIRQGTYFTIISGIGWCVDFGIFSWLCMSVRLSVVYANILSSMPAITFVFLMATRHIFVQHKAGLPLWGKYVIYTIYQGVLVTAVSFLAQEIYELLSMVCINVVWGDWLKLLTKVIITPITMMMNFVVMKILAERL